MPPGWHHCRSRPEADCIQNPGSVSIPRCIVAPDDLRNLFALPMTEPVVNIAAYQFAAFPEAAEQQAAFATMCAELGLKGTVLLTPEGINLFLAGTRAAIDSFLTWLRRDVRFAAMPVKESRSPTQPFKRLRIKVRDEIITMRMPMIQPLAGRAPAVAPVDLKRWLDQGHDDAGRPIVMLDTRNGFEVAAGTFNGAQHFDLVKFTEFPAAVAAHQTDLAGSTVVTFCTGGIRCEKAAILMERTGFEHVYQLDGGILGYFEAVGGAHYTGTCFVFDERDTVDAALQPVAMPRAAMSRDAVPAASCSA